MRLLYFIADILLLWLILLVLGIGVLWLWRGFDELAQLMMLGYGVVSFFKAIGIVRSTGGLLHLARG